MAVTWDQIGVHLLRPGLRGNSALWTRLVAQHRRLPLIWSPPIVQGMVAGTAKGGATPTVLARWRVRGHADGGKVLVRARLRRTTGTDPITVTLATDPVTVTTTITASNAAEHVYARVIAVDGPLSEVTLSGSVASGSSAFVIDDVSCCWVDGSGEWVDAETSYTLATEPVSSERVERLIQGPGRLARARPVAVYGAVSRARGVSSATTLTDAGAWGVVVPGYRSRTYKLDLYLEASATGAWTVTLGQSEWTYSTTGWKTETVTLGPGEHLGRLLIQSGSAATAQIRTIQLWRTS